MYLFDTPSSFLDVTNRKTIIGGGVPDEGKTASGWHSIWCMLVFRTVWSLERIYFYVVGA